MNGDNGEGHRSQEDCIVNSFRLDKRRPNKIKITKNNFLFFPQHVQPATIFYGQK